MKAEEVFSWMKKAVVMEAEGRIEEAAKEIEVVEEEEEE